MSRDDEFAERVLALAGATGAAGIEVLLAEPGRVHLAIDTRPDLLQFKGYFHGGVISGIADLAAAGAVTTALPTGRAVVTISLHVNFLAPAKGPLLLGPMSTLLNAGAGARGLSTATTRAILDSIGTRLDEGRELNRYLIGLLVFLGLLGTFWGLLETVHSISGVIDSMKTGADTTSMFDDLKSGLSAPIAGMSISFTSSLFGLAGSLILGFLDLQAGQAQNRFYGELEDFLASHIETTPTTPVEVHADKAPPPDLLEQRRSAAALANLAEGIQGLVTHMRQEQQLIRDWVEAQASQQEDVRRLLQRLTREHEPR